MLYKVPLDLRNTVTLPRFDQTYLETPRGSLIPVRVRRPPNPHGTLVFCDGLGCSGFVFERLFEILEDYEIVHFRYTGHGEAPRQGEVASRVEALVEELGLVLEWLDRETTIVGHSLGAQVALELFLSRSAAQRVRGLALVSGSERPMTHAFKNGSWLFEWAPKLARFGAKFPRLTRFLWKYVPSDPLLVVGRHLGDITDEVSDRQVRPYFEGLRSVDPSQFLSLLVSIGEHDLRSVHRPVTVPCVVIAGENDSFTPLRESVGLAQALGARLLVVERGTHLTPLEAPEVLAAAIEDLFR